MSKSAGQIAYEAYKRSLAGKAGLDHPCIEYLLGSWEQDRDCHHEAWEVAAVAVIANLDISGEVRSRILRQCDLWREEMKDREQGTKIHDICAGALAALSELILTGGSTTISPQITQAFELSLMHHS